MTGSILRALYTSTTYIASSSILAQVGHTLVNVLLTVHASVAHHALALVRVWPSVGATQAVLAAGGNVTTHVFVLVAEGPRVARITIALARDRASAINCMKVTCVESFGQAANF